MQVKCKSSAIEFIRIAEAQPSLAVELVFDGKVTIFYAKKQQKGTKNTPFLEYYSLKEAQIRRHKNEIL